jgi:hypothetical protein
LISVLVPAGLGALAAGGCAAALVSGGGHGYALGHGSFAGGQRSPERDDGTGGVGAAANAGGGVTVDGAAATKGASRVS